MVRRQGGHGAEVRKSTAMGSDVAVEGGREGEEGQRVAAATNARGGGGLGFGEDREKRWNKV